MEKIDISKQQATFLQRFGGEDMPESLAQNLQTLTYTDDSAQLNAGVLSRDEYEEVRTFMERVGGKWKSAGGKHADGSPKGKFIFQQIAPKPIIETFVEMRFVPAKNPLDFFPTPREAALELLVFGGLLRFDQHTQTYERVWTREGLKFLEPSAGVGGLCEVIREFYPDAEIHCIELNPISAYHLRRKGFTVFEQDFLAYKKEGYYDFVVMNPPFDGKTYIRHVQHAWQMVEPTFGLVAGILPNTQRNAQAASFWGWVHCIGASEPLPSGSFKASGTNVETVVFYIDKELANERAERKPYNGYATFPVWHLTMILENNDGADASDYKELTKLAASAPDSPPLDKMVKILEQAKQRHLTDNGIGCLEGSDLLQIANDIAKKARDTRDYQEKKEKEKLEVFSKEALKFVPKPQAKFVAGALEEYQDVVARINQAVTQIPDLYGQDGKEDKTVYLRYFGGGGQNWYVLERDIQSMQTFGYADLGQGGELGYFSLEELKSNHQIELDFHFEPCPLEDVKKEHDKSLLFDKLSTKARQFVPAHQATYVESHLKEYQNVIWRINGLTKRLPNLSGQSHEQYKEAIVYLRYFSQSGQNWYILEKEPESTPLRVFGYTNGKFDYFSVEDLRNNEGIELDFSFEPLPLRAFIDVKEAQKTEKLEGFSENEPKEERKTKKLTNFSKEARKFVPVLQAKVVASHLEGYQDVVKRINQLTKDTPKIYGQNKKPIPDKIAYLRYFSWSGENWYVLEKDHESEPLEVYGYIDLGENYDEGEFGYFSLEELKNNKKIELDFHFEPTPMKKILRNSENEEEDEEEDALGDIAQETAFDSAKQEEPTKPNPSKNTTKSGVYALDWKDWRQIDYGDVEKEFENLALEKARLDMNGDNPPADLGSTLRSLAYIKTRKIREATLMPPLSDETIENLKARAEALGSYKALDAELENLLKQARRKRDSTLISTLEKSIDWTAFLRKHYNLYLDDFNGRVMGIISEWRRQAYEEEHEAEKKRKEASKTSDDRLIEKYGQPDQREGLYFVFAQKDAKSQPVPIFGGYKNHLEAIRALQAWEVYLQIYESPFKDVTRYTTFGTVRYPSDTSVKGSKNAWLANQFPELAPNTEPETPPTPQFSLEERIANLEIIYGIDQDERILERIKNLKLVAEI